MAEYVIVLDPGHGSEQYHGGEFGPYIEKDIDLMVAMVMKDRLEKYENVKVVMTRTTDVVVDLKDRCTIAKANKADYFISIHFNTSVAHNFYGSEIWLPVQTKYYNQMYPFANELMKGFEGMGLFNRGIKTRLSSNGKDNYYAVLKHSSDYGIPSCIIEHCHLDNTNDTKLMPIANANAYSQSLMNFGINDADSLAKALHLKSSVLGVDYTNYQTTKGTAKGTLVKPDETPADVNKLELISTDSINSTATVKMTAKDSGSCILYYQYSTDGGITFSELLPWPRLNWNKSQDSCITTIKLPANHDINLVTCVYNAYDKPTLSNVLSVNTIETTSRIDVEEYLVNKIELEGSAGDILTLNTLEQDTPFQISYSFGTPVVGTLVSSLVLIGLLANILKKKFIKKNDKA